MKPLNYKANLFGYLVLSGPWGLLAIACLQKVGRLNGYAPMSIICFVVSLLWGFWLLGFRIQISEKQLEYRDGLYRKTAISLNEIISVKQGWKKQHYRFGASLKFRSLIIKYKTAAGLKILYINPLPFNGNVSKVIKTLSRIERASDT
ncbi:hypothetical protein M2103_000278 [Ereboglobus sp. PH5-5]|uniref:hypothetical protein n=1 Tax=Ereboglobus sp. PH5-5 TaxID=2940529 RepID=UPI0024070201|nr:hypothetical protein [Ereboglobus sp. PH5-5]MDF9832070.1 hypothetical protein [Ereboglobus sp. PH5-5]